MNKTEMPKSMGVLAEFQRFLTKTNAIALAIGVIMGGAATKLVSALVDDILNPFIGAVTANVDLASLKLVLGTVKSADGKVVENALMYGHLLSAFIDFIIVMAVVFILIKIFAKDMLAK